MAEVDYEADIEIDESGLDVEWLNQPKRMLRYCRISAEARRIADLAKERLDIVKAKITLDVQSNPDKYDLSKATKDATEAAVLATPEYERASTAHIDAKFEAEVAAGAVRAFDQRKSALENLVRLHAAQYFAGPSVPRDLSFENQKALANRMANRRVAIRRRAQ